MKAVVKSLGLFLLFLPAAVLVAGLFGMIHNQISYSVSDEYFTKFKFIQFHLLDPDVPERIAPPKLGFWHPGEWEFRWVSSAARPDSFGGLQFS
jgi:hypothetical protein